MERIMESNRSLKILGIVTFILIFISLILINNSPVTGYELSIYSKTSPLIWIFLIMGNIFGIIFLMYNKYENNWLGFFILTIINFIILAMSAMRGYYFYNIGDSIEHYKIISGIISRGFYFTDNTYPITHVFMAEISEINNLGIQHVMAYMPPYFSIIFMISVVLLARSVLKDHRQISLTAAAASVFLFSYYHIAVYPSGFSVLILPLLFYLYFKANTSDNLSFKGLFLVLLFLYTFFHPSTALMLIFFLLTLELTKMIFKSKHTFKPVIMSSTLYILWNQQFWMLGNTLKSIFSSILGKENSYNQNSYFITEGTKAVQNVHGLRLAELSFKMYGIQVLYGILSLLAILMIIRKRKYLDKRLLINLSMLSAIFLVGTPINFAIFLSTKVVSIGRLLGLNYIMIVTPILVGFYLSELIKKFNDKNTIKLICIFMISISFILSMFSVYRSPWLLQQNWQVTYSYIDCLKWFTTKQAPTIPSQGFGFYQVSNPSFYRYGNEYIIPQHFNYSYNRTFGEQIVQDRYILISVISKLANADPILADTRMDSTIQWGFNDSDFNKFENEDNTVNRLYSNGELNAYLVESIKR